MLLSCIAYVVIPLYTLLFVYGTNWFTSNLSVIGSWPTRRMAFFLLGILIGFYYYEVLKRLLIYLPRHIWENRLLSTAFLLLLLAVTIPYLPDVFPLQAILHVASAFLSSVFLALCLYLILWRLSALSPSARYVLRPYRISMVGITAISILLLIIAGIISTALELFFIIATTILVQKLYKLSSCIFFH